jgi:dimethylhistidine N-methyltransferase
MIPSSAIKKESIYFHEFYKYKDTMAEEVKAGLSGEPKTLSPKFFYDKRGSELFDRITQQPEYYPTKTELDLLKQHMPEIAELVGSDSILMELGSGSSIKIRLLLESLQPDIYVPMDISREHLIASSQKLAADYPWLEIHAACVDYSHPWKIPDFGPGHYNAFFPGSSIGNFEPDAALKLLKQISALVGQNGGLLMGVDVKKDITLLENAYNDANGVTADFNLNILAHINQHLHANFERENFAHKAFYNEFDGRIEMHLESLCDHQVTIGGNVFDFTEGETIHTENSYKYTVEELQSLAAKAGFKPVKVWMDENQLFSIHYMQVG